MSPSDLVQWLQAGGPWAALFVVATWLKVERDERHAAQKDARELRDRLITDRGDQAEALAELGEATRARLADHDRVLDQVLGSVRALVDRRRGG